MKLTPEELVEAAKVCLQIMELLREHLDRMHRRGKIGSPRTTEQINVLGKLTLLLSYLNKAQSAQDIALSADAYEILQHAVKKEDYTEVSTVCFNERGNLSIARIVQ